MNNFGASGPLKVLQDEFGFRKENVVGQQGTVATGDVALSTMIKKGDSLMALSL